MSAAGFGAKFILYPEEVAISAAGPCCSVQ
jgi:hypothetical protein